MVFDEMLTTGAVIIGRRTGDLVGYWGGDHPHGAPNFVPTHEPTAEDPHQRVHDVTAYTARGVLGACVLEHIEPDLVRTLEAPGVLHLRYQADHA